MNAGQSFRLAIKALTTSKMRSLLTMLGIIIGVASVIVILALGNGVQGMIDEQVDKLGINMMQTYVWGRGDGSTMDLDPSDMYDLVEANPDVLTGVSPYVSFQATLRHGDQKFDQTQLYGWPGGKTCASSGPIWPKRPSGAANRPWGRPCPSTAPPTRSLGCWTG